MDITLAELEKQGIYKLHPPLADLWKRVQSLRRLATQSPQSPTTEELYTAQRIAGEWTANCLWYLPVVLMMLLTLKPRPRTDPMLLGFFLDPERGGTGETAMVGFNSSSLVSVLMWTRNVLQG
jgi:hypothetical protein